jgi:hypothetical protein
MEPHSIPNWESRRSQALLASMPRVSGLFANADNLGFGSLIYFQDYRNTPTISP